MMSALKWITLRSSGVNAVNQKNNFEHIKKDPTPYNLWPYTSFPTAGA
jgi:hypothetical protein